MVNKVILIGNICKEPEIKNFDNGGKVANFPLATNETYKDKNGEKKTLTEYHNIVANFPKMADIVEKYLHKGDRVYIEGKLHTRSYEGKAEKHYVTEIHIEKLVMLGSAGKKEVEGKPVQSEGNDDLPF